MNEQAPGGKKRFLIVEDDKESCEVLKYVLAGFDVTFAHSVATAMPHFVERRFDLFMLDNWLPDGSGVEFCREIRFRYPDIPIIFTSAAAMPASIEAAENAGADRYITKPIDHDKLLEIIKELL